MKDPDLELLQQFPQTPKPVYHEGMGDLEPDAEPVYGRPRIVYRVANIPPVTRDEAEKQAMRKGIKFESFYPTARFWCFVVYE